MPIISTNSSDTSLTPHNSIDYIFTDPPFGGNLMYSELNFFWEAWLKVRTNNLPEAIENSVQKKGPNEYRALMTECFREAYRILKPGRWMTVEFSNTKAAVWNSIQTALSDAGFIVANVSALDKKQGSFKAVTTTTAVKQDLIISAYKPNGGFEDRFVTEQGTEEGVWDFVKTHLKYLPVIKMQGKEMVTIPERDHRILFDQMVAYYVKKGYMVPISSPEFQIGLEQRFIGRDGMYFLPKQVSEYDKKKLSGASIAQTTLFVTDEASAIQWLRLHLKEKPQTFQEVHPEFIQETQRGWSKNEVGLELGTLLEQNFLKYDGTGEVPSQIHRYLSSNWKEFRNLPKDDQGLKKKATDRWYVPDPNKAADLEKLRERALLREFDGYTGETKRLKVFRIEAVRAGFKKAWQEKDYRIIIAVAKRIPPKVLEEDPKLLMWYDQAVTRVGE
ncbi:DNA methyltransferase [Methanogenium sp. MK-MG]|uniref:DNA methyltransferase n=1 Tax=Methanogenium sp. MK-MG TaxID=2599926 RepID=UPI001C207E0D|nr:DNA methyltransferase [Methanogenium sp. MK-MG]